MESHLTIMFKIVLAILTWPYLVTAGKAFSFIDRGVKSGDEAHGTCPGGSQLPVIRTQAELEAIQDFLGSTTINFWLDAHMNPDCVGGEDGDCSPSDVFWEDGGAAMDESLYTGWLTLNIDETDSCIMIWASDSGPKLDDTRCTNRERTICIAEACDVPPSAPTGTSHTWNDGDDTIAGTSVQ